MGTDVFTEEWLAVLKALKSHEDVNLVSLDEDSRSVRELRVSSVFTVASDLTDEVGELLKVVDGTTGSANTPSGGSSAFFIFGLSSMGAIFEVMVDDLCKT